jgi:hypothetical protein
MTVLDAVVFRVDGQEFTRSDVLRWAERHDAAFASRVRRRLALAARAGDDEPPESVVDEAAANFRYERGLEDADAMQRWLDQRNVSVEAWWEALRRSVLETTPAPATPGEEPEVEDDEASPEEWLADLCSTDLLGSATLDLARRVAVSKERGLAEASASAAGDAFPGFVPWDALNVDAGRLAECDARLDSLTAPWESWRSEVVTGAALKSAVDHHGLEWLAVDVVLSWWPAEDEAREALWCVKDDGQELEAVAREAHRPAEPSVLLLEDTAPALHDLLLAAAAGDVVGPVQVGTQWVVASVRSKRPPSLADARVRAVAERVVERAAAAGILERHVVWPDPRP